jgi:hypothetical protein
MLNQNQLRELDAAIAKAVDVNHSVVKDPKNKKVIAQVVLNDGPHGGTSRSNNVYSPSTNRAQCFDLMVAERVTPAYGKFRVNMYIDGHGARTSIDYPQIGTLDEEQDVLRATMIAVCCAVLEKRGIPFDVPSLFIQ